jgi:hypothetical protein
MNARHLVALGAIGLVLLVPTAGHGASETPPVYTPPANQAALAGESKRIALGSFSDADGDGPYAVRVGWGDGSETTFQLATAGEIGMLEHRFLDRASYTVSVEVADAGGVRSAGQFTVRAVGRPVADGGPNHLRIERSTIVLDGRGTSELGPIAEFIWRQTGGPPVEARQEGGRLTISPPAGTFTFELVVRDELSRSDPDEVIVWTGNSVPNVSAPGYQVGTAGVRFQYRLGWFVDIGDTSGPWIARVDWGDGTPHDVFDVSAWGELAREHLYSAPGRYWAVVSIRDHRGSAGAATFRIDVDGLPGGVAPQQLCVVPKLRGKTLLAARRALAPRCRLGRLTRAFSTSIRRGRILAQSPRAGLRRPLGARVRVVVSRGRR